MNTTNLKQSNQLSRMAHLLTTEKEIRARVDRVLTERGLGARAVLTSDSSHTKPATEKAGTVDIKVEEPPVLLCAAVDDIYEGRQTPASKSERDVTPRPCITSQKWPWPSTVKNPMNSQIDRSVDELVQLCRIAGALEADLTIRGRKRKAKAELNRINRIVRDARQHLIEGVKTIRCRCWLESPSLPLSSCPEGLPSSRIASRAFCSQSG